MFITSKLPPVRKTTQLSARTGTKLDQVIYFLRTSRTFYVLYVKHFLLTCHDSKIYVHPVSKRFEDPHNSGDRRSVINLSVAVNGFR